MSLVKSSDKEIFRREIASFGRPLQQELPEATRATYKDIADRANDLIGKARSAISGLPPIYFDFIVNPQINAVAFRADKRYFIGLNTGTIYMLRLVIGRMLSDPRPFAPIGDPSEERKDLKPITGYIPNADSMYRTNELLWPQNELRAAYAGHLQDQAIMFFIGHEIAHISHGHVDYLADKRRTPYTSESSKLTSDEPELRFERQCLEQDADRRSIISRIDSLRVTMADPKYKGLPWAQEDQRPEYNIRDWSASLSILFRLFGDGKFSQIDLAEANYPPLPIRRFYSETVARWEIDQKWSNAKEIRVLDSLHAARHEVEKAFATILGETMSTPGLDQARTESGVNYTMRLQDYWNSTMVEKLRAYSYEF